MTITMPLHAKELPFFGTSYDTEPLEAMRPARIALPLLAAGFLLAPHPARAQSRRATLQTGIELVRKGRESEALAIFRKLTEDDPHFLEAWNNRAALEAATGDLASAQISLERAMACHPDVSVISKNLQRVRSRLARIAYDTAFGTNTPLPPLLLDLQREPLAPRIDSTALRQRDSLSLELARLREAAHRNQAHKDSTLSGRDAEIRRLRAELDRTLAAATEPKAAVAVATPFAAITPQATASPAPDATTLQPVVVPTAPPAQAAVLPQPSKAPSAAPPLPPAATVAIALPSPPPRNKPTPKAKAAETAAAVLDALQAWANAWSAQDVDQYLSFYSSHFVPLGKPDRKAWESYRRERITTPKSIKVEIVSPKVRMLAGHHAEVVYRQIYQTDEARLTSRKRLEFAWEQGVWRIFAEKEAR